MTETRSVEAVEPISGIGPKLKEFVKYREVLTNFVRKELKVRYKNSALGAVWSMLNPLLYLAVFYVVFNFFLTGNIPKFHIYLLAGLLPWTFFSNALFQSTGSVVGNGDLVKKVYFPREMLPLSSIGAGLVHFFLQLGVLIVFLTITRYPFSGWASLLVPAALIAEIVVLAGFGLFMSAINVKVRDAGHLLELALLAWFWMTPIVYPVSVVSENLSRFSLGGVSLLSIYLANPVTRIVLAFQRGIYGGAAPTVDGEPVRVLVDAPLSWYFQGVLYTFIAGLVALALGWWVFRRMDGSFAEEL
jgi:ABC-2 type transport system permease protein